MTATTATPTLALSTLEHFGRLLALGYTANVDGQDGPAVPPLTALVIATRVLQSQDTVEVEFINPEAQTVEFTLTLDREDGVVRICE